MRWLRSDLDQIPPALGADLDGAPEGVEEVDALDPGEYVLLDAAASARADRDAATLRAHREHRLPWDQRDRTAEESAGPRLDWVAVLPLRPAPFSFIWEIPMVTATGSAA